MMFPKVGTATLLISLESLTMLSEYIDYYKDNWSFHPIISNRKITSNLLTLNGPLTSMDD